MLLITNEMYIFSLFVFYINMVQDYLILINVKNEIKVKTNLKVVWLYHLIYLHVL